MTDVKQPELLPGEAIIAIVESSDDGVYGPKFSIFKVTNYGRMLGKFASGDFKPMNAEGDLDKLFWRNLDEKLMGDIIELCESLHHSPAFKIMQTVGKALRKA